MKCRDAISKTVLSSSFCFCASAVGSGWGLLVCHSCCTNLLLGWSLRVSQRRWNITYTLPSMGTVCVRRARQALCVNWSPHLMLPLPLPLLLLLLEPFPYRCHCCRCCCTLVTRNSFPTPFYIVSHLNRHFAI